MTSLFTVLLLLFWGVPLVLAASVGFLALVSRRYRLRLVAYLVG
jgi:hypothetical protein